MVDGRVPARVGSLVGAVAALTLAACFPQFGEYGDAGAGGRSTTPGSGGSTSSIPCAPGPEDCLDGCDNDGNGDVDCADAACSDFICLPDFPAGWDGPVVLSLGGTAPTCPAPYDGAASRVGVDVVAVLDATCACTCGAAQGGVCTGNVILQRYGTTDCSDTPSSYSIPAKPSCSGSIASLTAGKASLTPTNGACDGTATLTNPGYQDEPRGLCQAARHGGGCGDGVCVPRPPPGFEPRVCAVEPGDVPCPSGDYAVPTLFQAGTIDDQRACPTCACGPPTGASCNGFVQTYTNSCAAAAGGVVLDGQCDPQSSSFSPQGANYTITSITQGSCAPLDPSPPVMGGLVGGEPITVCCSGLL